MSGDGASRSAVNLTAHFERNFRSAEARSDLCAYGALTALRENTTNNIVNLAPFASLDGVELRRKIPIPGWRPFESGPPRRTFRRRQATRSRGQQLIVSYRVVRRKTAGLV